MTTTPRPPERRVTMADVAAAAGVSKTTVSLVLGNKQTRLAAATQERVRQVADELGYRRDLIASSMRTDRTATVALLSDRLATTSLGWGMVAGAQAAARARGHMLLITNTEGDPRAEVEAIRAMRDRRVDGLVFGALFHRVMETPALTGDIPVVLLDAFDPDRRFPAIVPDDERGGREATQLLLDAGHRRIGFVNAAKDIPARTLRLAGHRTALREAGVDADDRLVVEVPEPITPASARAATRHLLDLPDAPTGIFCFSDVVASGCYQAIHERGLRVPEDISVVGFDDHEALAAGLDPPLTTMALPHVEMGRWAVDTVIDLQASGAGGHPRPVRREHCPPVLRRSVGPPPG